MSEQIQIAKTIAEQIGARRMMALGAQKMVAIGRTDEVLGGLTFQASLFGKQRVVVVIALMPSDTYTFSVYKAGRGGQLGLSLARLTDIHCEELGTEIELAVEQHFAKARA